jgi:hypothetical protein
MVMSASLRTDVNCDNWVYLREQFMDFNGGKGFFLTLKPRWVHGELQRSSIRQWGAWRAWFKSKKISTVWMDAVAKGAGKHGGFSVPAEWPHMFDMQATLVGDHIAGNAFYDHYEPEIEFEQLPVEKRRAVVEAARMAFPIARRAIPPEAVVPRNIELEKALLASWQNAQPLNDLDVS